MKNFQIITSLFSILIFTQMAEAQKKQSINLYDYQWKNRLILLFAESEDNGAYQQQMQYLDLQQSGLEDRDLLVFSFFADGTGKLEGKPMLEQDVLRIRNKYKVGDEAQLLILIGKDGGEKMRKDLPVQLMQVFGLIDQMPMRQREMRDKKY